MLTLTNVFFKVNERSTVLSEQLIHSQIADNFPLLWTYIFIPVYKTTSHWSIYSPRWTQTILSHSVLTYFLLLSSHLRLGLLIFLSLCFYSLLRGQYLESATTTSFPISSYCISVVTSCRHCKTNICYAEVLHKYVLSLCSDFNCFVCFCYQYTIHSFFCSAVSKCVLDNMMVQGSTSLFLLPTHSIAPYHAHFSYRTPKTDKPAILILIFLIGYPDIVNGYDTNEISLHSIRCIVSSEAQFETWWWPSERAETCSLNNKYYTTLLVVFDCTTLYHHII